MADEIPKLTLEQAVEVLRLVHIMVYHREVEPDFLQWCLHEAGYGKGGSE